MRAMQAEKQELTAAVMAYESAKEFGKHHDLHARAGTDPGLTLIVARIAKGLSQRDLAWRLGLKEQQVQRYESDRYSTISLKNYSKIAALLGVQLKATITELKDLRGLGRMIEDVSKADIKRILKHGREYGWFPDDADEEVLRRFIAENRITYGSPSLLRTGLNVKDHTEDILLHAWRARVASRAQEIITETKPRFSPLDLSWLSSLVKLSALSDGPARAREFLLEHGIVLIAERQIPGLAIDGAAFLEGDIPIIGMTLRKDTLDNFWFTLLHETAHAILHYRTGLAVGFFDQSEAASLDEQEAEADAFASNMLIPDEMWRKSTARISRSPDVPEKFAKDLGIHPAIVFGRIIKERHDYSIFSQKIGTNTVRKQLFNEA